MARFYTNENFAVQVVWELRRLGHDVLTSLEAGNAKSSVPAEEVLQFATPQNRILLTYGIHSATVANPEPKNLLIRVNRPE